MVYKPDLNRKRTWPMIIPVIYLGDRDKIVEVMAEYSPSPPIMMTSPALISRILLWLLLLPLLFGF